MKTQISKESYDEKKRYSGVYQQQGRMLTDADWNNLVEIVKHRLDDALVDVVGSGTPRHRKLQVKKAGSNWKIVPGHLYAEGVIAELQGEADIDYDSQPDLTSPRAIQSECYIYADVWERTVTAIEDGALMDSALHGADTCTRTRTMLQVKWCDKGSHVSDLPKVGDAELTVTIREGKTAPDDCDPCASEISVDSRTGNELFRLEVHDVRYQGNDPMKEVKEVWLKWSSENGAEQCALKDTDGNDIEPPATFKDSNLIYEFYSVESEQNLGVHPKGTPLPLRGTIDGKGYTLPSSGPKDFVRRWDGYCVLKKTGSSWAILNGYEHTMQDFKTSSEVALTAATGKLKVGLEAIHFELPVDGKKLLPGDYWTVPLREREISAQLSKKAESSSYVIPALLDAEIPHGVKHHYLELATVTGDDPADDPEADRKYAFPPLTEMTRLFMAGGDGQEVVPGHALPQKLRVGVANGEWPVVGATVRFTIKAGGGSLAPINEGKTDLHGIAECEWTPGNANADFQVKASLVDPDYPGDLTKDMDPPVYFYANLITADQVVYENPQCSTESNPTVNSLLSKDINPPDPDTNHNWPDFDKDGHSTVKDVLDALLCKLKAKHVPYDPNIEQGRWKDIKEIAAGGALTEPNTVQDAIDSLIHWLESTDIRYQVQDCGTDASPTVRSRLGITPGTHKIDEILDQLLCHLKAEHIPFTDKCPNGLYPDNVKTVADALKVLCNLDARHVAYEPGCDYLKGKEAETVQEAIDALCAMERSGDDCKTRLQMFGRGVVCGVTPTDVAVANIPNSRRVKVEIYTSPGVVVDGRGCIQRPASLSLTEDVVAYQWEIPPAALSRIDRWKTDITNYLVSHGYARTSDEVVTWESFVNRGFGSLYSKAGSEVDAWARKGGRKTWSLMSAAAVTNAIGILQETISTFQVTPVETKFHLYLDVPETGELTLKLVKVSGGAAAPTFVMFREMDATTRIFLETGAAAAPSAGAAIAAGATVAMDGPAMQEKFWRVYNAIACMQENDGSVCLGTVGVYSNKIWVCPDDREQVATLLQYYLLNSRGASVYEELATAFGARG